MQDQGTSMDPRGADRLSSQLIAEGIGIGLAKSGLEGLAGYEAPPGICRAVCSQHRLQ